MGSSINHLIGTFSRVQPFDNTIINEPNLVCIDTSNNRIGINTLDPSYAIHVVSNTNFSSNDETISSNKLKSNHLEIDNMTDTIIIFKNLPSDSTLLQNGQLYKDDYGNLKIK